MLLLLVILIGAYLVVRERERSRRAPQAAASGLPEMAVKPQPVDVDFMGCPPEGDGGDPLLNRLKNRSDEGAWVPVDFAAVERLPWPQGIERRARSRWTHGDAAEVAHYEGIPISITGYLAGAKEEGPESPNCHGDDHAFRDFHLWLVSSPGADRSGSIVVEVTPRLRRKHPEWSLDRIRALVRAKTQVRISGWLMLDPEHPDQVRKTRGTIWEIHPIMKIEVAEAGAWRPLDRLQALR
jgi:hypothetical protein